MNSEYIEKNSQDDVLPSKEMRYDRSFTSTRLVHSLIAHPAKVYRSIRVGQDQSDSIRPPVICVEILLAWLRLS